MLDALPQAVAARPVTLNRARHLLGTVVLSLPSNQAIWFGKSSHQDILPNPDSAEESVQLARTMLFLWPKVVMFR